MQQDPFVGLLHFVTPVQAAPIDCSFTMSLLLRLQLSRPNKAKPMINTNHAIKSHYINFFLGKKKRQNVGKHISLEGDSNFKQQKANQCDSCGNTVVFPGTACAQLNHKTEGSSQEITSCLSDFTAGWMLFSSFQLQRCCGKSLEFRFYVRHMYESQAVL